MIYSSDIKAARDRINGYVRKTPVLAVEAGALFDGGPVTLKLEHLQHTGSFKARGAFNALLSNTLPKAGVVAFSGGNHGAALAYAATKLGVKSTIFVPDFAGPTKIGRMRHFGAEVIVMSEAVDKILQAFLDYADETGARAVHPYDEELVLAGQGTVGLELEQQVADIDTLVVSVGGGGLIGGLSVWFDGRIKIVAVESDGAATYATALAKGANSVILPTGVAASALGASSMGALPLEILAQIQPVSVTVPDSAIYAAQTRLWDTTRIIGEPGAATALAALTSGAYRPEKDERVCVLVCGSNATPNWFLE
ncbi:MAG: threonine/serine dehydratase [Paracoccaceae bacterium]